MSTRKSSAKAKMALVPVVTAPAAKTKVVMVPEVKKKRRRRKRKGAGRASRSPGLFSTAFLNCLNDPFDYPPVPIGLGCMIETAVHSAYLRNTVTTNADGSFQLWFSPGQVGLTAAAAVGGFVVSDSGLHNAAPTFAQFANATNQSSITSSSDEFRIIGAGMRIFSLQAQTASPGIIAAGIYPADASGLLPNNTGANKLTTDQVVALPHSSISKGYDPVQVTWRPVDLGNFNFSTMATSSAQSASQSDDTPIGLYCAGLGLPASTTVWFEVVAHYEVYDYRQAGTSAGHSGQAEGSGGPLAEGLSSIETLWNYIRPGLAPAVEVLGEWTARQAPGVAAGLLNATMFPKPRNRRLQAMSEPRVLMFN